MNGLGLLAVLVVVVILFCSVEYRDWRRRDQDRRIARQRERGLA